MTYKTHITGGILLCVLLDTQVNLNLTETILLYSGGVIGSLLPDIDHTESKVSQFIPFIPTLINNKFGHRTITHSILGVTLFAIVIWYLLPQMSLGLIIGAISHVILDMMTAHGVPLLYPFNKSCHRICTIKTSSPFELMIEMIMVGIIVLVIFT